MPELDLFAPSRESSDCSDVEQVLIILFTSRLAELLVHAVEAQYS